MGNWIGIDNTILLHVFEMKILRVFIRRTSQTPIDNYVRIGMPDLFRPKDVDEVHISAIFTWDIEKALELQKDYLQYYPKVLVGGPAFINNNYHPRFYPGRYVKKGITITTRGCNNNCPWCLVPKIEGRFEEINIEQGNIIQDNNILMANKSHLQYVLAGFNEPIQATKDRLKFVYEYGALPFIQVYQPTSGKKRSAGERSREDNSFVRKWSRPAIIKTINKL